MCRSGEYLVKEQKKGVTFSTFLHIEWKQASESMGLYVKCACQHARVHPNIYMNMVLNYVHACLPGELLCFSDITNISVCLVCSCAFPRGPSQDISSQYLHEASETSAIYRPCFCWCSLAVRIISVCTQTPVLLEEGKHTQSRRTAHPETERRKELNLSLCFFRPLVLFFSGCLSLPCLSHPSILRAIQRLSCFPPLPRPRTPSSWDLCGKLPFKTSQPCFYQ